VVAPIAAQQHANSDPAPPPPGPVSVSVSPPASTPMAVTAGPMRWRWPAEGPLGGTFVANDPTRQGVSIVGSAGQAVLAAADGVVVYSGSGLIGYGELIIIKHSEEWLSAYGHNRKRLAEEGARVTGGQQIAEMGRSGASRDMLHFEIRRNGRPVDPVSLLPRR
jgi:lipoprotein NlpD